MIPPNLYYPSIIIVTILVAVVVFVARRKMREHYEDKRLLVHAIRKHSHELEMERAENRERVAE